MADEPILPNNLNLDAKATAKADTEEAEVKAEVKTEAKTEKPKKATSAKKPEPTKAVSSAGKKVYKMKADKTEFIKGQLQSIFFSKTWLDLKVEVQAEAVVVTGLDAEQAEWLDAYMGRYDLK